MSDREKIEMIRDMIDTMFEFEKFDDLGFCQCVICSITNVINQKGEENGKEKES